MKRLTVSIEADQYDDVEDEAESRGVSKSQVVRERLQSGEDAVNTGEKPVNTGEDVMNHPVKSGEDVVKLRERVADLEERVGELEDETPAMPQNVSDSAVSHSSGDATKTPDRPEETAGSGGGSAPLTSYPGAEELEAAWGEWIEDEGPNTLHGKEMMWDLFDRLRSEQIVTTAELREAWYEEWPDAYGDAKSLWDSMKRHIKEAPGVEHPGTGQWRYAGDDVVADTLDEYL
jgi:hypothetical protein